MLLLEITKSIMRICIRIDNIFFRKPTRPSLPLRKAPPPHQASLPSETRGCNRPTRCSEPLRSKVGGASKPSPDIVRDGTAWDASGNIFYVLDFGGVSEKSGVFSHIDVYK